MNGKRFELPHFEAFSPFNRIKHRGLSPLRASSISVRAGRCLILNVLLPYFLYLILRIAAVADVAPIPI